MLNKLRHSVNRRGFTLMELLVVIAIIAMLISILVPSMRGIKVAAKKIEQKSLFRNIEIGLELFREEFDNYPDSGIVQDQDLDAGDKYVCGAHHLAETMLGRDGRGFDPKSNWHGADEPDDVYASDDTVKEGRDSLARRQEPYIELRKTASYLLDQIYPLAVLDTVVLNGEQVFGDTSKATKRAPILTDCIEQHINVTGSKVKRSGTPIVYFKANTASRLYKKIPVASDDTTKWIYTWEDNADIFNLPPLKEISKYPDHIYKDSDAGKKQFYEDITNHTVSYDKPYNANTFILMSAGWDSVFGTKDDITNFD